MDIFTANFYFAQGLDLLVAAVAAVAAAAVAAAAARKGIAAVKV